MPHPSGFYIDKITKSIEEVLTGRNLDTKILLLSHNDLKIVTKKKGWFFNWKLEYGQAGHRVFKLNIKGNEIVQGLISIEPMDNYVELHLLEMHRIIMAKRNNLQELQVTWLLLPVKQVLILVSKAAWHLPQKLSLLIIIVKHLEQGLYMGKKEWAFSQKPLEIW